MRAWLGRRAGPWRRLRARAWLPAGTAVAQWTLVGCAAIASGAHTLGFLGRSAGSGRSLDSLGGFAQVAGGVGALASFAAYVVVTPLTWWLIRASRRHGDAHPESGRPYRPAVRRRIGLLVVALVGPPLAAAWLFDERALAVPPLWTVAEVPLAALALWAVGASGWLDYWMRRCCLRIGLAGLLIALVVRRLELLPGWMTAWPQAGAALALTPAEAQYLSFFTLATMGFGFVALGSLMLAARPPMAPGSVILAPSPMPPLPGPIPTPAPAPRAEPVREVELPRHPSGRVMRRLDV